MNKLLLGILLGVVGTAGAQSPVAPGVADRLRPAETAQLSGFLGQKLDASYEHRILAQDVERLVAPFRTRTEGRCWQTEFWGKWFTSAVLAYRYRPEPKLKAVLDRAVTELLATQTPDGYLGNYSDEKRLEFWDIWGRKYCLLGLLAYHDLTGDPKPLAASRRLADHLMRELTERNRLIVKQGNHRGMAATSVLEPMCLLHARTGEWKYLDFAEEIVRQWESENGPQLLAKAGVNVAERWPKPAKWWTWEQGMKAYEMMSCYEGLLELHRLTGKKQYREAVEKTWENIRDTELNVVGSGSSVECWFGGKRLQAQTVKHYQETCVTATWVKLSQQLLRLTGEAKYADAVERSAYNGLLGSMKPDGSDWTKYANLAGQRQEGEEQCGMGLNCCVASGPRGLFTLPLMAVTGEADGLRVNFFNVGTWNLTSPGGQKLRLSQETAYPVSEKINLTLSLPKPEALTLRLRIPAWSQKPSLSVNGQAVENLRPGTYAELRRTWQTGDVVTLTLDLRGRVERLDGQPEALTLLRGPLVLARDARLGGPNVDEALTPVLDRDGYLPMEVVPSAEFWLTVKAPFVVGAYHEGTHGKPQSVTLGDYASAGSTYDERSRFRVWLPQLVDPEKTPAK
jgi:hypothetical protein